ncbi:hypothetical protein MBLNU459_g1328t1 [Dothideomycetes sp. NU459]
MSIEPPGPIANSGPSDTQSLSSVNTTMVLEVDEDEHDNDSAEPSMPLIEHTENLSIQHAHMIDQPTMLQHSVTAQPEILANQPPTSQAGDANLMSPPLPPPPPPSCLARTNNQILPNPSLSLLIGPAIHDQNFTLQPSAFTAKLVNECATHATNAGFRPSSIRGIA